MKYKSIIVTERGGPEGLQIMENTLRPPVAGEVRVRILATPVCQDDVAARTGNRPFLPKIPFVPGYATIGIVDAIGEEVTNVASGDRVAALTNYGSYTEYLYWPGEQLVHVPATLDPVEAATLILNYLVAYQIMHRVVQIKAGDKVLIIGASGGVGTAFLQLGRLAELKMYGVASTGKHHILAEYGATPIEYRNQDLVQVLHQAEPEGIDYVFNGMADEYLKPGLAVLRRGGTFVHYGGPESFTGLLRLMGKLIWLNILPDGKTIKGYGTHRVEHRVRAKDWAALFHLLEVGKIKPIIDQRFPLLEAAKANERLASGQVTGNVVLVAPALNDVGKYTT